jgi:hypothetical protein
MIKSGVLDDLAGNHFAGLAKNDLNFTTGSSSAKTAAVSSVAVATSAPDTSAPVASDGHSTLTIIGHDGAAPVGILKDVLSPHGDLFPPDAGTFNQVSAAAFSDHGQEMILTPAAPAEPILEHWTFG